MQRKAWRSSTKRLRKSIYVLRVRSSCQNFPPRKTTRPQFVSLWKWGIQRTKENWMSSCCTASSVTTKDCCEQPNNFYQRKLSRGWRRTPGATGTSQKARRRWRLARLPWTIWAGKSSTSTTTFSREILKTTDTESGLKSSGKRLSTAIFLMDRSSLLSRESVRTTTRFRRITTSRPSV